MNLRSLELKTEYRSDKDDLVQDFYLPCLNTCILYRRAVGFFTSHSLSVAAQGVTSLIHRSGKMQLIASPRFEKDDITAIQKGYATRDVVLDALTRDLSLPDDEITKNRLSYLAWLIANNRLEIRIAVPHVKNGGRTGIYHEKLGIFSDTENNIVAFTGSPNETYGGLVNNFETVDVFCSWSDPQERVALKVENYERLWYDQTQGIEIIPFPEAVQKKLLTLCTPCKPEREYVSASHVVKPFTHELWMHQLEAIDAWENSGRRGIVSMATGTGKTRTALAAAQRCDDLRLLVIAVPRKVLVEQWADELRKADAFPDPILVFGSNEAWQDRLFTRLRSLRVPRLKNPVVVIGTMQSLSGERCNGVFNDCHDVQFEQTMLIVDEVHNAGAGVFRQLLREDCYSWRLGLSATPIRPYDEEGTELLLEYFGNVVYDFSLEQALREKMLSPYDYHVFPANLGHDEYEAYQDLTAKIIRLRNSNASGASYDSDNAMSGDSEGVRQLLIQRARIAKNCAAKVSVLGNILDQFPPRRCLVYCAEGAQLSQVEELLQTRRQSYRKYTADTPAEERRSALRALAFGDVAVVLSIDCLDEGVDVPEVDQAIILASSTSERQFIQRRGRVLRKAAGKEHACLIDVATLPPADEKCNMKNGILLGEIKRIRKMASLARNHLATVLSIKEMMRQYGVTVYELLQGETDE